MRILHVLSSLGLYGAERVVLNLIDGLPDAHVEAALFAKANGAHEAFAEALSARGVTVHLLPDGLRQMLRARQALGELLRNRKPDIVHSHGYKPNVIAATVCRSGQLPRLICSEHGFTDKSGKSKLYGALDRQAIKRSSVWRVCAASGQVATRCAASGVAQGKILTVPNGAPPIPQGEEAAPRTERDIDLLFLGRLSIEKGADLFVDAIPRLQNRPGKIVIAGDGPLAPVLKEAVSASGLVDDVHLLGFQPDAASLLARAKWLVLPSRTEAMPMSLLEAFARGTPAIATAVGEVPSVYAQGTPGRLLHAVGDPAALASALDEALAADTDVWTGYQREALALAKGPLGFDKWIATWRGIYAAATGGDDRVTDASKAQVAA